MVGEKKIIFILNPIYIPLEVLSPRKIMSLEVAARLWSAQTHLKLYSRFICNI